MSDEKERRGGQDHDAFEHWFVVGDHEESYAEEIALAAWTAALAWADSWKEEPTE